jgi:hypothetical protein
MTNNLTKMLGRDYKLISSAEKGYRSYGFVEYYQGIKSVLNAFHSLKGNKEAVIVIGKNHAELYLRSK